MYHLRLRDFVPRGLACHFAPARITEVRPRFGPHDHDFSEVMWVDSGKGWHHVNGFRRPLTPGMVVFIRPADCHEFAAAADSRALRFWNLAFSPGAWTALMHRYELPHDPFAAIAPEPLTVTLQGLKWANLLAAATDLHAGRRDRLALDYVLLAIARASETSAADIQSGFEVPPLWLTLAVSALQTDDRILAAGTRGFAKLTGRSPEHVARMAQRFLGKTPTDLVNEAKMARAVHRLIQTNDSVIKIALDCGYPNLSHFYKVFAAQFHTTPRRYRLQQQAIVRPK